MAKKLTLEDIFNDDEFGLLESKAKISNSKSEEERLIDSFQEINAFFKKNKREPKADVFVVSERSLGVALKELRKNNKKIEILKPYDIYNLLGNATVEINSIDDILNDDEFGLLDTDDTLEIFKLKNVPSLKNREKTDFVARRKAMKDTDFVLYEELFKNVHKDLREGKRKLVGFNENNLQEKSFYILDGIMFLLESITFTKETEVFPSGERNQKNGRTKCIFENQTFSNHKFRSLIRALYDNGKMITNLDYQAEIELYKNANLVNESDLETGWIYILQSKSTNKAIAEIKDLYKIGFSKTDVRDRIKNAAKEPTYLMAEVHLVSTYKCYNVNPHKFEQLLHRFFAEVCLNVDIHDDKGRRITPREWFVVPLPIIDRAITLILSGDIVNYGYDKQNSSILLR